MSEKYQIEIDNFIQMFGACRNLRIILYGIGRYTATLLEGLEGFNIVGLMDKDPDNTGRVVHGVAVVDKDTAEQIADLIIINTAETYWDIIYRRIRDIRIPVYYLNGEKAFLKEDEKKENPFAGLSYSKLLAEIEIAEVISFDFFDTLFMRSVCNPQDVFRIMERQIDIPFIQVRDQARRQIRVNYSLGELYKQIAIFEDMSYEQIQLIKRTEIDLEKKLLNPREPVMSLLRELLDRDKEIYLISDMYLPKEFYMDVLSEYGVSIPDEAILLSNELNASKLDGTLWEYYAGNIVRGRRSLHIGDNIRADIEKPMEFGIKTYFTPNVWELFLNSSLKDVAPHICNIYDTCVMGCVLDKLFQNPFILSDTGTMLKIRNNQDMGYCVFGPVLLTFLLWILNRTAEDGIEKIVFMSRDGYFLKEDFEYLCGLMGTKKENCYIGISRQLAMMASIETRRDLLEYVQMPYTGNLMDMLKDRLGISCQNSESGRTLAEYIDAYLPEIEKSVARTRKDYLCYLDKFELDDNCAIVDIGYYGNNQRYLNRLLGMKMTGYYFNANLSGKNENAKVQKMTACFQSNSDVTGENSWILRKQIYLESFLTAPYGMVKAVDTSGSFICMPDKKNQKYFEDKKKINEGIKQFIADYMERFGSLNSMPDPDFADKYYGICFNGGLEFDDGVKKSFYNDNAMMNRLESSLFY